MTNTRTNHVSTANSIGEVMVQSSARPSRIAVFGATRGIGRHVVERALACGHSVSALVRGDGSRLGIEHPSLTLLSGDIEDTDAVHATTAGCDAVVCSLGAPALSRSTVRSAGTRAIISAMSTIGVDRLVCVSVLGVGDSREGLPAFLRWLFFPLYLRRVLVEHAAQEQLIRNSELSWTIVRPPHLTDGVATGQFEHGAVLDYPALSLKISRADVAGFILDQLGRPDYIGQAVGVSYAR